MDEIRAISSLSPKNLYGHKSITSFVMPDSIRNKLNESAHYLNINEIDIVLFPETCLKQNDHISIPNFKLHRRDRVELQTNISTKVGGNVAM